MQGLADRNVVNASSPEEVYLHTSEAAAQPESR